MRTVWAIFVLAIVSVFYLAAVGVCALIMLPLYINQRLFGGKFR
jgi:hypothetical protein